MHLGCAGAEINPTLGHVENQKNKGKNKLQLRFSAMWRAT